MQDSPTLGFRLVVSLVLIVLGGWILGGTLNLAAIVSPRLVTMVDCPPGSTAKVDWIQQSWDHPGEKTMTVTCHNSSGTTVTPLSNAESQAISYKIFFPLGVAIMAIVVVGLQVRSFMRRRGMSAAAA